MNLKILGLYTTNRKNVFKKCSSPCPVKGAFTYDVRFLGRYLGQAVSDSTK